MHLVGKMSAEFKKAACLGGPCEIMGLAVGMCSPLLVIMLMCLNP